MTVESNSIILNTMREQIKQTQQEKISKYWYSGQHCVILIFIKSNKSNKEA